MKRINLTQLIILVFYFVLFLLLARNLDAPYLWFDEAGQFFVSKGLNHDSEPFGNEKGLASVIKNNAHYNLDPGGFSILLHFWAKISNHHVWLRILPFVFFVITILSIIYLSYLWSGNLSVALLTGIIPIIAPLIANMAFEIRAFSMEYLGIVMGVIAIDRLNYHLSKKALLGWGLLLSAFITSRYSAIVVVFIISLIIVYLIFRTQLPLKEKALSLIVYATPILISLVFIYIFSLNIQNPNAEPVSYMPYLKSEAGILLQPKNIVYLSFVVFLSGLLILQKRFQKIQKYRMLLILAISANLMFISLSLLGKYPWTPYSNKLISLVILTIICVCAAFTEISSLMLSKLGKPGLIMVIVVLITAVFVQRDKLSIRTGNQDNTYFCLEQIDFDNFKSVFVDRWASPCVRYLYEYGALKSERSGVYPEKFTFAKGQKHNFFSGRLSRDEFYALQPKMNQLLEYDLIIAPELHKQGENDRWNSLYRCSNFFVKK